LELREHLQNRLWKPIRKPELETKLEPKPELEPTIDTGWCQAQCLTISVETANKKDAELIVTTHSVQVSEKIAIGLFYFCLLDIRFIGLR